ncbi:unnamed protein product, partial [marine sediment metagenome]
RKVLKLMGVEKPWPLQRLNATPNKKKRLSKTDERFVRKYYKKDFELLNYK